MGLFKKNNPRKDAGLQAPMPPITPADPGMVYHKTMDVTMELNVLMKQYESIAQGENTLTLEQYKKLTKEFQLLAFEFEKIYELMKFDMEKLEEIKKYHLRSNDKRQALVKQLNEPLPGATTQEESKEPDKQAKK